MKVLIAYAGRYGATREIAERIARALFAERIDVSVLRAAEVTRVRAYDAVIVGSAVYEGDWLGEACELLESFSDELAHKPLWLFSDGLEEADPDTPLSYPKQLNEFSPALSPQSNEHFGGRVDSERLGTEDWLMNPGMRTLDTDNRDWQQIDAFAQSVAQKLSTLAGT